MNNNQKALEVSPFGIVMEDGERRVFISRNGAHTWMQSNHPYAEYFVRGMYVRGEVQGYYVRLSNKQPSSVWDDIDVSEW